MKPNFNGIILAGGKGDRVGNRPKALLKLKNNLTFVENIILSFKKVPQINKIVVVTGYFHDEIVKVINNYNVATVNNPSPWKGMFSSILVGLQAIDRDVTGVIILPVDCPSVSTNTIYKLISVAKEYKDKDIIPIYNMVTGHPVILCKETLSKIKRLSPETHRLDFILLAKRYKNIYVEVEDKEVLGDIDYL